MDKRFTFVLVLVLASSSLIMVKPARSSTTRPSVPEFTLKFVDNSYNVPSTNTTTIDPYTGNKIVTTEAGYYVQNDSIEVIIKNQPFVSHKDANSNSIGLYYNFSSKGHFSDYWVYPVYPNYRRYYPSTSNSDYTVIAFGLNGNNGSDPFKGNDVLDEIGGSVANVGEIGGQVDFRVQAFIGYSTTLQGLPDPLFRRPTYQIFYTGENSDWSSTQTITIPDSASSPASPPSPTVPGFTVKLSVNNTIELKIKNQPFDKNNIYNYSFVYNVRIRTIEENWTDLYDAEDGYPTQSDSDHTVLSYVLGESAYYPPADYPLSPSVKVGILPTSGQVDFQVEAMIGYRDRGVYSNGIMPYVFKGEKSGWSNTQTITISGSPTPTPEPEVFPAVPVLAASIIAVVVIVGLLVYHKKRRHEVAPT